MELPLLADKIAAHELTVNLSARITDDEFYGSEWTYSGKLGWRPIPSLLVRATQGTSYRAPNLRELFLLSQSGFLNVFDPCLIPPDAFDDLTNEYIPAADDRDEVLLRNCEANGVDPRRATNGGFNTYNVEVSAGGATDLQAETSKSWSGGFSWEQPFTNAFGLSVGATYYDIVISNTIIEPTAQFVVNDCYFSTTGGSPFCNNIEREDDPDAPLIDQVGAPFTNRDSLIARGIDVNLAMDTDVTVMDQPITLSMDFRANHPLEVSETFRDNDGNRDENEFQGEWGFPNWRSRLDLRARMGRWNAQWRVQYLSSMDTDPEAIDEFGSIQADTPAGDTCLGPPDDVLCRDVGFASNYFLHSASGSYRGDTWRVGFGVRNVFDQEPPVVDGNEVLARNNTPLGYGYDLFGRYAFLGPGVPLPGVASTRTHAAGDPAT